MDDQLAMSESCYMKYRSSRHAGMLSLALLGGGLLVALGWFLAAQGLERANQLSGILGVFIALAGLAAAVYGLWASRSSERWPSPKNPPDTSGATEYVQWLLSSGIPFQGSAKKVLRQALDSATPTGLLTAEHLALALLNAPGSSWLNAIKEGGTNPAEVIALLEIRSGRTKRSDAAPEVTDTVRAVMDDAIKTARRQRQQIDNRLLTMSLLRKATGLTGDFEQIHKFPVGTWLYTLQAPRPAILTPKNSP